MRALLWIVALGLVATWVLPWWGPALAAFVVGWWKVRSAWRALGIGFAAVGLLWLGGALVFDGLGTGQLTERVAAMVQIEPVLLFVATALVGGVLGGLATLSGYWLQMALAARQTAR